MDRLKVTLAGRPLRGACEVEILMGDGNWHEATVEVKRRVVELPEGERVEAVVLYAYGLTDEDGEGVPISFKSAMRWTSRRDDLDFDGRFPSLARLGLDPAG